MDINIIEIILLFLILYLWNIVNRLEGQVKGLQYILNQVHKPMDYPINNELRQLIQEGKEIKAIKKVRETLGLSLLEAKQYIDALKREDRTS